jgi:pimeloyl-ACP methyl ester carboxylesterase
VLLLAVPLLAAACAAPVSAVRVDPRGVHQELTGSVLSTGEPSRFSRNVVYLHGLHEAIKDDSEAALVRLRADVLTGRGGTDALFALAELSFWFGQQSGKRAHLLAAAIYAWAFLFPEGGGGAPDAFDPRLRLATDLYNRGITEGLASADRGVVEIAAGSRELPWGTLEVSFDTEQLAWGERRLTDFVPVAELEVRGLATRFRRPGIGAALAASIVPPGPEQKLRDFVAPRLKVPATALLRIPRASRQLERERVQATLELYAPSETEAIEIAGRSIPLEGEPTAALAWTLQETPPWASEFKAFFGGFFQVAARPALVSTSPYQPGRIPVVFVHGTASSLGRWAEMYNVLQNDPVVRQRYQVWFFSYDSGTPIVYSAMLLREALADAVAQLDPEGRDAALRRMVVIGHSQGGLLTKMTVVSTGSRIWDGVSIKSFEEVRLSEETRSLIKRAVFVEPLPFVTRVVFICTPHRGSFLAGRDLVTSLIRRLVTLPARLTAMDADIVANRQAFVKGPLASGRLPTAVDNMSPRHPFVRALSAVPIAPGVAVHSIVGVEGTGPVETGDDGVVKYESAHIDGVESEVVVRWNHSLQGRPQTIEEVRRILTVHTVATR